MCIVFAVSAVRAQTPSSGPSTTSPGQRAVRIGGHANLNGIWQAMNTAYWNLEAHSAEALNDFWQLGAIAAIPAGRSVVRGNEVCA